MLRFFESGISPHQPSGSWLLKPLKHRLQNTSLQHQNGCRHRKAVRPVGRAFLFTIFCQLNYYLQACILSHPHPPPPPFFSLPSLPSSKLCSPHHQTMHTSKTPPVQSNPLPFNENMQRISLHHQSPLKTHQRTPHRPRKRTEQKQEKEEAVYKPIESTITISFLSHPNFSRNAHPAPRFIPIQSNPIQFHSQVSGLSTEQDSPKFPSHVPVQA